MALSECKMIIDKTGLELVEHGKTDFPIACYNDDLGQFSVDWHWHEELELILVSEGSSIIAIENQRYIVNEGDGFFINSGILHGCWDYDNSSCRFHSIVFHPRLVGGEKDSIFWTQYIIPLLENTALKHLFLNHTISWQQEILECIENAWQACTKETTGYEFQTRNQLSWLTFLLYSHMEENKMDISSHAKRTSNRMKQMLQYISNHYAENITIEDLSKSASISESECLRCFKKTIDTTPIQYLKSYRIKKAAEFLTNTDTKIIDIGLMCGFQDMSYFAKVFRQTYNCTPSEYRNREI